VATPMGYIDPDHFWCCQCFEIVSTDYASFDVDKMVRVDVCFQCRMAETYWMIRKWADYGTSVS
jgi:hypothetical protein